MNKLLKTTITIAALLLSSGAAMACESNEHPGCPGYEPPKPPPVKYEVPDSSDPWVVTPTPIWMPCGWNKDGDLAYHVEFQMRLWYGFKEAKRRTIKYCTSIDPELIPNRENW